MADKTAEKPARTQGDPLRGNLDLLILSVLADQSRYGYLIQQKLEDDSGGMVTVQAGTLYPILHKLEAERLIRSRWERTSGRGRKWYELTAAGRRRLVQQAQQWDEYARCLRKLLSPVLDSSPRPAEA
jgi:DNA-binding PadR family transcriptional regulator